MTVNKKLTVGDLGSAEEDELDLLHEVWNATGRAFPADTCVHELVREQAASHPGARAVVCGDRALTYAGLDLAARHMAGALKDHGIRPGDLVALALPPSAERLVAVLGTLYAGAAYLPLDLDNPAARLRFLLTDGAPGALVTDTATRARVLAGYEGPVLLTDATDGPDGALGAALGAVFDADADAATPGAPGSPGTAPAPLKPAPPQPAAPVSSAQLAYVIYTSGSTGRPKGVGISHRSLVNRLLWMRRTYGTGPHDRVLHKTSFGFDVSVWEQLLPLISGGCVVVSPPGHHRDMRKLVSLIGTERVTMLHFVPSLLPAFLEADGLTRACAALRTAVCSGEALPRPLADAFTRQLPHVALHNLYGPTEATIDVTSWPVAEQPELPYVPIGRPIDNTRMYVLNARMEPVPPGSEGELYIGGEGVGVGYRGRPALTADRFVPDPFTGGGARLYRTGDRGRFAPDGAIEYLGRDDHQVKLRGHRIELGEIEAALLESGDVRQAVVVVHGEGTARRLAAFVSAPASAPADGTEARTGRLRAELAERLPAYMVPTDLVWLPELPLTTAGKVDRAALPQVTHARTGTAAPPRTETERTLAALWSGLLGHDDFGIDDDFFKTGGDSVSSMRLVARARREGVHIEVSDVFSRKTIRALAATATATDGTAATARDAAPDLAAALLAGIPEEQVAPLRERPGVTDVYPLAPMQEGMLFRGLYWPDSDAYFNQNVLELTGEHLDEQALREAWRLTAERYEILRTGFVWEGLDQPLQYVRDDIEPPWRTEDWTGRDPADDEAALRELLAEDRERGLALDECPLYRLVLVRRGEGRHYLIWSHHHILLDGWCLSLIWGDFFKFYEALAAGRDLTLPEVRPYRDYVAWIRAKAAKGDAAKAFWQEYLRDMTATPFSRARGDQEGAVRTRVLDLDEDTTRLLADRARAYGVTTNTVTQAAWSLLLGLYAGADEVVYGLTVAGRPPELEGVETMVGLFINTVPLRVRLAPELTVTELLDAVHHDLAATAAHADVPLAEIKSWATGTRLTEGRIFDNLVAFENYPEDNLPQPERSTLGIRDLHAQEKTEYPFGLIALPGDRLGCHFTYDSSHFTADEVERMTGAFTGFLRQLLEHPDARLGDLRLLADADRATLDGWNDTATERAAAPDTLLALFDEQAARTPAAQAVTDGALRLTYAGLDEASRTTARALAGHGTGEGDLVALCVPRSAEFLTALLAVLRCGAVPVLLDPAHPAARRRALAADAGARAVVTTADPADFAGLPVLRPDGRTGPPVPADGTRLRPATAPPGTACLVHTSGSTGAPKGVMLRHEGLVNRMLWSCETYRTEAPPRLLATAGTAFDIVLWEMFFPLAAGGSVVIAPPEGVLDPAELARLIRAEDITVVHLLPTLLAQFLDTPAAAQCTGLRHLVSGGEAVTPAMVRAHTALGLPAVLHQAYGPSEASISVTHWTCVPEDGHRDSVPLGHPVSNTRLYVLDDRLRQLPAGVEGELAIAGIPLAGGYWRDPALTARRFVADPYGGGRLYLTGDRARRRPDGALEFLGRRDRQLKIRGHRLEPAETDAVLTRHPSVARSVTLGLDDGTLATFVVPAPGTRLDLPALRDWALGQMPDWMLGRLLARDSLPLTTNGKVDQQVLAKEAVAAPGTSDAARQGEAHRPRTELERRILATWEDVLGSTGFGVHDDFFALGGHSLMAVRLLKKLRAALPPDVSCDMTQIFKAPTVASLAEMLVGSVEGSASAHIETLNPDGTGGSLFLVHPGEGLALAYRALAPHLPDLRLHLLSNPRFGRDGERFGSIEEMARLYAQWVHGIDPVGPYTLGGWSFGGTVALEMARQMSEHGVEIETVLLIDSADLHSQEAGGPSGDPEAGARRYLAQRGFDPDTEEARDLVAEQVHNGRLAARHPQRHYPGRVVLLSCAQRARGGPVPQPGQVAPGHWDPALLPGLETVAIPGEHDLLFDDAFLPDTARAIGAGLGTDHEGSTR
ncbi:amino acid adenylation domain-containing protein [Streptomyces daliensis]